MKRRDRDSSITSHYGGLMEGGGGDPTASSGSSPALASPLWAQSHPGLQQHFGSAGRCVCVRACLCAGVCEGCVNVL